MEKKNMKKIKAGAAIFLVVAVTFLLGAGPSIVADDPIIGTDPGTDPDPGTPPGSGETFYGAVQVTLSAVDEGGSGVAETWYRVLVGGSREPSFALYPGSFVVDAVAGNYQIEYYSIDGAGNIESPHKFSSFSIVIDTQAPSTSCALVACGGGGGVTPGTP